MAIHNRDTFLSNLAANLGRPRRMDGVERPTYSVQPQYDVLNGYSTDDLISVLQEQCNVIHTDFIHTNRDGLSNVLMDTIARYEGKSIIASNDKRNQVYGLDDIYSRLDQELDVHIWDHSLGEANQRIAEQADVGISFSDITLAESATVTLLNNKDNGRSISLLPKTYIAIIPKDTLVPRMTQAAKQLHEADAQGVDVPSCVSFVSGPSNSADIEMNLIVGVHGPIKATYIVVD
ncbi:MULTISPECIES: LutC/YkgG family protein [Virgibacillus]|uniref:Lactate utilization protein C n=2 Tax=Virgibacillus TaxID=84406 RepID=A0A024QGP8_9BACI|nr:MULTISPECIES: lactate utilization protein C [Virgibacillus]EQB39002.1 hypothetical protein M948_01240 [Virgibacillus sp. CM-4]MYL43363.1 lactate utilization protein C [Virgibacillus massiliensis]GGJ68173.1 lactate utilization protein C [Virgibacillus kapii]CDQ41126.1 Lactate utilization protein C [Virgibacillus massiliensis]